MISHADGDDAALLVFRNRGVFIESHPCIYDEARAVNFSQIKLLDESVLRSLASQDTDKQSARALESEQIARYACQASSGFSRHGSHHGHARSGLRVGRHELCGRRVGFRNQKRDKR
jgi:hypothetical protein